MNKPTHIIIRFKPQLTLVSAEELALLESILPDLIQAMQAAEVHQQQQE
ncbi:hypothetical protein [Gallionella capsiferriformans]|nr:hypothetical protein [Gallionella capsiferriformans]